MRAGQTQEPDPEIERALPSCNTEEEADSSNVLRSSINLDVESQTKINFCKSKWRLYWYDITIVLMTSLFFGLTELGVIPSSKSGFYCKDPNLSHKFQGDTITAELLVTGSILFPLILMFLGELVACYQTSSNQEENGPGTLKKRCIIAMKLTLYWYYFCMIGLSIVLIITCGIKMIIGEPRPHFFDTCRPDTGLNCLAGTYIEYYECTNANVWSGWFLRDSAKSFPSGHTSASIYTSIFIMVFLQQRIDYGQSWLLLPWLQLICSMWGITCSLTRIMNHRHHWWDVLGGFFIGIIVAIYTLQTMCRYFTKIPNNISASVREVNKKV